MHYIPRTKYYSCNNCYHKFVALLDVSDIFERRKYQRFQVGNGILIKPGPDLQGPYHISDISQSGLSYYCSQKQRAKLVLSIFHEIDGLCLNEMHFKAKSNSELNKEQLVDDAKTMRCGGKFIKLTRKQKSSLKSFISKYCLSENNTGPSLDEEDTTQEKEDLFANNIQSLQAGEDYDKSRRESDKELEKPTENKIGPEFTENMDFSKLGTFNVDTPIAGIFFFVPYILESGALDILKKCTLPESSDFGPMQACLSMLFFKLIGRRKLSNLGKYEQDSGLGTFAGVKTLPKPAYISAYSRGCSEIQFTDLQEKVFANFKKKYPAFYNSEFIYLDFHPVPYCEDETGMFPVLNGAGRKTMKNSYSIFAYDGGSNEIIYARTNILKQKGPDEIKKYVAYLRKSKCDVNETLVFDSIFTKYVFLDELEDDKVKFLTLRKLHPNLVKSTYKVQKGKWSKVDLPAPKRKSKHVSIYESEVKLSGCTNIFRQITVKDHGKRNPTFLLTNNKELSTKSILKIYVKYWIMENNLEETFSFLNLNAPLSPLMVHVHFDILWTIIAGNLYRCLAQDLECYEKSPPEIFKDFVDIPGSIVYDGNKFEIRIREQTHAPILNKLKISQTSFDVPWLGGKTVKIVWTT